MARHTNLTSIYTAQKNVITSGTPVQLDAFSVPSGTTLIIQAKNNNTGNITVGNSSDNALNTGTAHTKLANGQAKGFQVENANAIWIDSTVSGEGVEIYCEN